ncbi:Mur ligase family protein [Micrococcus sp. 2A]|uniref:bifunctional folylpolyglutamate synthase/dihydrofolate synthase n=1 Tax=Micrococcus sp. 2A TaxID=3142261 RepID=UPI002618A4AF|nr:Mur ligase family protein [uncultured Micrococcus sp.]
MSADQRPGTVEEVYRDLLARAPENKMQPRLDPVRRVLALLGDPQDAAPVIHLTGTNGKTSTARMIEAVLRAYGLRTGRYTSPHLQKVTERISIDGEPVSDETFVRVWGEILPIVQTVDAELEAAGEPRLTYFEAVTVLGFAVFADEPVEVVVLEVGLGGVTDATNVADGVVSVVTPISLDHTDLLGDSEAEIAEEKAGIVKPGGFLVSAVQERDAAQVLLEAAQSAGVPFRFEGVEFGVVERALAVGGQQVAVRGLAGEYPDLFLPLLGEHQAQNLALAVAALEAFLGGGVRPLDEELLREGLAQVTSPGRLEVLRTAPTVIVDAAHNPDGVRATVRAVQESFGFTRLVLVVGVLQEKDAPAMLEALHRAFGDDVADLALTQSTSPRAIPAAELARIALDAGWPEDDLFATESVPDALEWAVGRAEALESSADELASGTGGGVLVLGSITLTAEVRALLGEPRRAGPVTVAARGLDPADLLDAVGLADENEDALDPEILELLDDADETEDHR